MSPDVYGAYRTAGDWYLLQIDAHGLWTVIGIQTGALIALLCAIGGARQLAGRIRDRQATRRGIRRLQQYANHPGSRAVLDDFHQPRKETP